MKNLFFIFLLAGILFSGCKTDSEKYEQKALDCWGKGWLPISDPSSKMLLKGTLSLDSFLLAKGYLGEGLPSDYIRFANDTQQIIIDENVTNYKWLQTALAHDNSVNTVVCYDCIKKNIIDNLNKLDSSDVLYKFAKVCEKTCSTGEIRTYPFIELYSGFTKDEIQKPLLKSMFYVWAPNLNRIHFKETSPVSQEEISPPTTLEDSTKTAK